MPVIAEPGQSVPVGQPSSGLDRTVQRLAAVSPSTLGHLRDHGLIGGLTPLTRPIRLAGIAVTVQATEYATPGLVEAVEQAGPHPVVVISRPAGSRRTSYGGVVASRLKALGVAGVIVDGLVTDHDQLVAIGIPTYHRGITPIVGRRTSEPAVTGVPLRVDGVVINPGDFVFGDSDGLGVLTPYEVDAVLAELEAREAEEAQLLASVNAGSSTGGGAS